MIYRCDLALIALAVVYGFIITSKKNDFILFYLKYC